MTRVLARAQRFLPILMLAACTRGVEVDQRLLELEGPAHLRVRHLGPVEPPRVVLSDGTLPEGLRWDAAPGRVAVVSDGRIEAVGPGTALVTGTWEGQVVSWTLEVRPSVVLQFVDPPARLAVGQQVPLRLVGLIGEERVDPGEVAWHSSDDDVLSVASGRAMALDVGTAFVTAESKLGSQATLQLQVIEAASMLE